MYLYDEIYNVVIKIKVKKKKLYEFQSGNTP